MPSIAANGAGPMKTARLARWLLLGVLLAGIAAAMIHRGRVDAAALQGWARGAGGSSAQWI